MKTNLTKLAYVLTLALGLVGLIYFNQTQKSLVHKEFSLAKQSPEILLPRLNSEQRRIVGLTNFENAKTCTRFNQDRARDFLEDNFVHCMDGELSKNPPTASQECRLFVTQLAILVESARIECLEQVAVR